MLSRAKGKKDPANFILFHRHVVPQPHCGSNTTPE